MNSPQEQLPERFRNQPTPVRQILEQTIDRAKRDGNPIAADGLPRYGRAVLARRMALASIDNRTSRR